MAQRSSLRWKVGEARRGAASPPWHLVAQRCPLAGWLEARDVARFTMQPPTSTCASHSGTCLTFVAGRYHTVSFSHGAVTGARAVYVDDKLVRKKVRHARTPTLHLANVHVSLTLGPRAMVPRSSSCFKVAVV